MPRFGQHALRFTAAALFLALCAAPVRSEERRSPARLFPRDVLVLAHVNTITADLEADYRAACPRAPSPSPAAAFGSLVVGLLGPLGPVDAPPFNRARFYRELGSGVPRKERLERLRAAVQAHRIATGRKLGAASVRDRAVLARELAAFLAGTRLWIGLLTAPPRRPRWALVVQRTSGDGPDRFRKLLAACRVTTRLLPGAKGLSFQGASAWHPPDPPIPFDPRGAGDPVPRNRTCYAGFAEGLVILTDDRLTLEGFLTRANRPGDPDALSIPEVASLERPETEARAYVYAHVPRLLASMDRGFSPAGGLDFLRTDILLELFRFRTLRILSRRGEADSLRLSATKHVLLAEGRSAPAPLRTAGAFPPESAVAACVPFHDLARTWQRVRDHLASRDRAVHRDRAGPTQAGGKGPLERGIQSIEADLGLSFTELASLCAPEVGFFLVPLEDGSPWNFGLVLPLRKRDSLARLRDGLRAVGRAHGVARGLQFRESRCAGHAVAMLAQDTDRRGLNHDCRTALRDDEAGVFVVDLEGTVVLSPRFGPVRMAAETWNRNAAGEPPRGRLTVQLCPAALWRYLFEDRLIVPSLRARPFLWTGSAGAEGLVLSARNAVLPAALSLVASLDGHLRYRELARLDEDRFELIRTAFETFTKKAGRLPASLAELLEGLDLTVPPPWLFHPADPDGPPRPGESPAQALTRSTLLYRVPSFDTPPVYGHRPCLADRRAFLRKHNVFLYVSRGRRGTYSFYVNALTEGSDRKAIAGE